MLLHITHPIGTTQFVEQCEMVGMALVHDRLRVKHILGFLTRLKGGLYESKEMAQAGLAYCAGRQTQVRSTFYRTFKDVLENYTLEEAWVVLETVMSYHSFYGGNL